jgi:glycosyltransferase involved in cell wall biosynthesis
MKLLFLCGREIDYTRNQVLLRAFRRIGEVETVVESGTTKSLVFRSARIALRAFPDYISNRYDLIFVGFYGHLLMIPIGLFCKSPILFDAFVSTYDTLTSDRLSFSPKSLMGKMAAFLDRSACHFANKILLDTPAHEQYFSSILGVANHKLNSLPVSCNEEIFYPRVNSLAINKTLVLSYSSYLPIHGIDTIINAAEILRNEPIQFRLIGQGPLYKSVYKYANELDLKNVTFLPPIPLQLLSDEIAVADICLGGHFGLSDKASRVIPGKIYQMLAMGKPVIAADSQANKELLQHGTSAYLCPAGNPPALAQAILDLHRDHQLCKNIGIGGRETYEKKCSEEVVTEKLRKLISEMINSTNSE